MTSLPLHGGDLAAAEARWGRPAEGWLDLSTGINPWPYPLPEIGPACWARLPDGASHAALLEAATRRWTVPGPGRLVAATGSQALIQALPRLFAPRRVAIVSPTYGEHARAWSAAGHQVVEISDLNEAGDAESVVVVNPDNPTGRTHSRESLALLAPVLAARGGVLVVDEAFADHEPSRSMTVAPQAGLVVLRSFGKFYGLAGLRLGFAVAAAPLAARLAEHLGPWPVSGPALAIGRAALADQAWHDATVQRLTEASIRLNHILDRGGLTRLGGTCLFTLARHDRASELYDRLGRAGILVRAFAQRPHWLRVGLPASERDEARLAAALSA